MTFVHQKNLFMLKYIYLLPAFCLSSHLVFAQAYWEQLNPPPGGEPAHIVQTTGGRVYAEFYDNVVYTSTDNGVHWQLVFQPFVAPDNTFEKIAIGRAGTLFAEKRLSVNQSPPHVFNTYRSDDNGQSWQPFTSATNIHAISEAPDGTLYAIRDSAYQSGGFCQQVLRSDDAGITWISFPDCINNNTPYYWATETDAYGRVLLPPDYQGYAHYSLDRGANWHKRYFDILEDRITITATGAILYWDLNFGLTRRTDDTAPATYIDIDSMYAQNYEHVSGIIVAPDSTLYLTNPVGLYKSADDGLHWQRIPTTFKANHLPLYSPLQDGALMANGLDGIYRSADQGVSWAFSAYGINRSAAEAIYPLTQADWWATLESGLWHSENAGQHWDLIKANTRQSGARLTFDANGVRYALVQDSVFRFNAGGSVTANVTPAEGLPSSHALQRLWVDSVTHTLFTNTQWGAVRLANGSNTWQAVTDSFFIRKVVRHPSGVLFAIMDSIYWYPNVYLAASRLFRSEDNGYTWLKTDDKKVKDCTVDSEGGIYALGNNSLHYSSDTGSHWIPVPGIGGDFIQVNNADQLFVFRNSNQPVYLSADGGRHWQSLPVPDTLMGLSGSASVKSLTFDPTQRAYLTAWQYTSTGLLLRSANATSIGAWLTGTVEKDADGDCSTHDPETVLPNWTVEAGNGDTWLTSTDSAGRYLFFLDTGSYQLHTSPPFPLLWAVCDSNLQVQLPVIQDTTVQDLNVQAIGDCALMSVQVAIPKLRRCFDNPVYIQFCNQGTEAADSTWLDLSLDPFLRITSSDWPFDSLGNQQYRFNTGALAPGACGQFMLMVRVDCDSTVLGQTHCVVAHIYPDSLCVPVPEWSGAEIQAAVSCQDTSVRFKLYNAGVALSEALDFIVIEDDVVLFQGNHTYPLHDTLELDFPANGHTWRIESEQEPGHPFSSLALAFTEGCGGYTSLGFINQFPVDPFMPFLDQVCVENTGSFDPNDKQGFPLGFGSGHIIRPGQELEYLIRFQNTGTDTAFTVAIRDVISSWLDPASVRPGASSHPYTWALDGQGALAFTFNNIMLPDSNVNEAASNGFVSFRIAQQPDVPLEAKIFNEAAIYFDFNAPVLTNKTLHTVGQMMVDLKPVPEPAPFPQLLVSPHPAQDYTVFRHTDGQPFRNERFRLFDALGHEVRQAVLNGSTYRFERQQLPAGLYFFRLETWQGQVSATGRLVLRP